MSLPVVIVGAGSSGCVLAHRLTSSGAREVLLLEAGPDYAAAEIPGDLSDGTRNSMRAHDWGYKHKPSLRALSMPLPRGRVVGGSSAVNTCIALRGQPEDYDEWAAMGLSEWTFERCLPAFKRLEHDLDFGGAYHGKSGPLPVRRHTRAELTPPQAAFLDACAELGLPACADSNAPGESGYGPHAMNKIDGRRISAAEAYLTAPVRARANLRIRARTPVRRILFRDQRAIGVEVEGENGMERIDASAVIVCSGAINTPALLLRSGVGPERDLTRLGIERVVDAPAVGRRLLDHPGTGIFVLARRGGIVDSTGAIVQTVYRYSSGKCDNRADMLLQPVSFGMFTQGLPLFGLVLQVGKPRGHGSLRFLSADPRKKPQIESHFFEDPQDRALAADALARCRDLLETRALRELGRPVLPWRAWLNNDAWRERAPQRLCDSGYHPCGTVPMGRTPSESAATDARGEVFGVQGLFVADASLMPTVPSSNIHLPTLMLAERIAEWLEQRLA
ncbi:MAG TPA: GMC family oxidoreductase N-terminal domain-containing protein [Polyangiales bacterium]